MPHWKTCCLATVNKWVSRPAVIVATGPSLVAEDIIRAEQSNAFIIAVSDAYKLAPRAEVIYAADVDWWKHHDKATKELRAQRWTCSHELESTHNVVHGTSAIPWGTGDLLAYGGNSGFQAINLAYFFGFRKIVLLGFDMGHEEGTPKHFFGEHPKSINRASNYKMFRDRMTTAAPLMKASGLTVINASRKTALTCFPKTDIRTALDV